MLNMEELTDADAERWLQLVARLRERRGELRESFMSGFPTAERYGPGRVPIDDVNEVVDDSMEMFLRLLADAPLGERLETYPERLGIRRAHQGIELQLLLEGVRWNFTVLWNAMRDELEEEHPRLLVAKVSLLLGLVERHIARVQRAYIEESSKILRDSQYATDRALAAFLAIENPTSDAVATAADALGVGPSDFVWVALALAPRARDLITGTAWSHAVPWQHAAVLIAPAAASSPELPDDARRGVLQRHPVLLASVPALVRAMVRLSVHLRSTDAAVRTDELLLRELHASTAARLGETALLGPGFANLRESERERLRSTFDAYCSTGSVSATAAAQGCHRNTVVSRLQRIRSLTGLDPYAPRDAAVLQISWGAH